MENLRTTRPSNSEKKDFRITTNSSQKHINNVPYLSELDHSKLGYSPESLKLKKKINLLSTPKLSSLSKSNDDRKFQKLFMSVEKKTPNEKNNEEKEKIPEKKTNNNFDDSMELEIEDQKPKELVGQAAVTSYYGYYKKLDKIRDKNKISSTNASPFTAVLSRTESDFLLPTKLGMVKLTGDENKIKINNFKYGDKYANVLSEGIRLLPNISHFNFSGNRLTEKGAKVLLTQIGKNTKVIDFSNNAIGSIGCEHIYSILISKECRIEELNLEGNKLGDSSVKHLCEGLLINYSLRRLNLSRNYLTNQCCDSLKNILQKNPYLQELYLYWNNIKSQGGQKLFQGLLENEAILVFDISWNSIGGGNPSIVPVIAETLQKNDKIIHLDLSNNYFTLAESKRISEALETNHSIYGFHFIGNYGYVDSKGFLVVNENTTKDISEMHINHRMNGCAFSKGLNKKRGYETLKDCCWICEGWNEVKFEWIPGVSGECDSEPIYLHFDFDYFEAHYMGKPTKNFKFVYERMVPPGKITFFFTADKMQTHSLSYQYYDSLEPVLKNIQMQRKNTDIMIERRNYLEFQEKTDVIGLAYVPTTTIPPRMKDILYVPPRRKKEKKPWSFPISIFKDWKKDDEEMLKKCFEFDWSCCRIPMVVKKEDDLENVKKLLYSVYRQYKEAYKYYSSLNPSGEVWSISQQPFTDFVYETNIIDGKNLELADVFIKLKATLFSEDKNNPRNPERSLIRYQLMEVMVRIAEKRYKASGICQTYAESVEMMIRDNLMPVYSKYNAQQWREEKYWNEACDDALKFYKSALENIYSRYSVRKVKPGHKKFMCVEEFHDMFKHANLYDENFVERDVLLAFNYAMMTQIDEISNDRIFQMTFVEFLEALSRCAEKAALPKIGATDTENLTIEMKRNTPLCYKIEALIVYLVKYCTDTLFKEAFVYPSQSIFDKPVEDEYEECWSP